MATAFTYQLHEVPGRMCGGTLSFPFDNARQLLRDYALDCLEGYLSDGIDVDIVVPPGKWDDASFTTASNASDRYYYTGATAVVQRWSEAAGGPIAGPEKPFDTGQATAECRAYCLGTAASWPRVLDRRAPMGHDYQLGWAWKLVLDFFDCQ